MNVHDSERMKGLLESLGLGEATAPEEADVLVFNTCTIREKADERFHARLMDARAAKLRDPSKVIVVGGCWSESIKDELFELYPFVDLAYGPGNISRLGDVHPGGRRRAARALLDVRRVLRRSADAPRAAVPGLAADLAGLQLDLLVLHRPVGARARAVAARGRAGRRGRALRGRGRARADAARPERQLLGARPARGRAPRLRRPAAHARRRARHRAHPLHEPAPEGHARRRDRRPPRMRVGVRARAPAAAVGLDAHPARDAAHVLARALRRRSRTRCARPCPAWR